MRSLVLYFEAILPQEDLSPVEKPVQLSQRLSPFLLNYMKKDPAFATEVQANLKNYENIAKMRARHLIKS
jgi:hypothetical protein